MERKEVNGECILVLMAFNVQPAGDRMRWTYSRLDLSVESMERCSLSALISSKRLVQEQDNYALTLVPSARS